MLHAWLGTFSPQLRFSLYRPSPTCPLPLFNTSRGPCYLPLSLVSSSRVRPAFPRAPAARPLGTCPETNIGLDELVPTTLSHHQSGVGKTLNEDKPLVGRAPSSPQPDRPTPTPCPYLVVSVLGIRNAPHPAGPGIGR